MPTSTNISASLFNEMISKQYEGVLVIAYTVNILKYQGNANLWWFSSSVGLRETHFAMDHKLFSHKKPLLKIVEEFEIFFSEKAVLYE